MSSTSSNESWLGWVVDYVSPASWLNWLFTSPAQRLDLENIPSEHDLTAGSSLIFELPISQYFQQQLKQLVSNSASINQQTSIRIEIELSVLEGSLASVTMSAESPGNPDPLMKIDEGINQSESITLCLDRVNTHQFQPRSWFITIISSFKQTKFQLTGRILSATTLNEHGKKTSTSRLQSAKLLGYEAEEHKSNTLPVQTESTTANVQRDDHAYHAMSEPTASQV